MLASLVMSAALAAATPAVTTPGPETLWFDEARLTLQAKQVLEALRHADVHGLHPSDYGLPLQPGEIDAVIAGKADASVRRRFEDALSRAAARFIGDLHDGRIDPQRAGFNLPRPKVAFDATSGLRRLASSADVAATLESFEPAAPPYKHLKSALRQYRTLARQAQLTRLPPLPSRSIKAGMEYAGAKQLRELLRAVGDLTSEDSSDSTTFDDELAAALRSFQQRHGLDDDGVLGPRTFAALTTPLAQRVQQIVLSMERWRWLQAVGHPEIVVNIPQYMLFALPRLDEPATELVEMPVIVGQTASHTRTPVFTSEITQVVFQPYWDVPRGILVRELLPLIRKDVSYLDRHQMEIVQGPGDDARIVPPTAEAIEDLASGKLRLRQRPGPQNSLGPVKLVMPNPYAVYLHGTPAQNLFQRSQRTFSHGCIRASDPAALVEYVLRDQRETWNRQAIDEAMCGTRTVRVRVEKPISVVVFYATAAATSSGRTLFFEDIYGHDRKLAALLGSAADLPSARD
jgi:murein L,D-transpeptidase YcbB/YkuD